MTLRPIMLSILALAACASPSLAVDRDGAWTLSELAGAPSNAPRPTLTIAGSQMSGFAGCNRLSAQIETDPNVAAFFRGGPAVTRMYCQADNAMAMEHAFLEALNRTGDARIEGGALVFFDVNAQPIIRFERSETAR